jgi:hypothetical protein
VELRALQKRVVEGLVAASVERTSATGRGFQDTGSTAKAFDGEELDWYVCNVASYHAKQSIDPSLVLMENEDMKRWLLLDDETLVRAAAVAVGIVELESLLAYYSASEEWFEAAKLTWAMDMVSTGQSERLKHGKAALRLLEQAGSTTTAAHQLELNIRSSLTFSMHSGPEKKQSLARTQALMAQNKSLRMDSLGLFFSTVDPRLWALFGVHPKLWDAGKVATQDTLREGFRLMINEGSPLFTKAAEESVGARKEYIRIGYELVCIGNYMGNRSTDEQTIEMHHQSLSAKWGNDGSSLTAGCMDYRFDRYFMISQGIGGRFDIFQTFPFPQGMVEHCGDVQQMILLFEKQLGAVRDFVKRGVPGMELQTYLCQVAHSFIGLELNALHPFGKETALLLMSCDGQCTAPSDIEGWYDSADWKGFRSRVGEGISSKDGLHHMLLKPTLISHVQAILSLSLASMSTSNFDLSWLDSVSAPNSPKLHDSSITSFSFANTRVLIAEVLEWQGRHKEAIR